MIYLQYIANEIHKKFTRVVFKFIVFINLHKTSLFFFTFFNKSYARCRMEILNKTLQTSSLAFYLVSTLKSKTNFY